MKSRMNAALAALLIAGAAWMPAQTRQGEPQASAQKASIEGIVFRAGTGQPLKGARVSLLHANPQQGQNLAGLRGADPQILNIVARLAGTVATVTTDDMGRFVFTGVDAGQYRVAVERDGYIRAEYGQRTFSGNGAALPASAGQQLKLDFQMYPASVVSGRVLNRNIRTSYGALKIAGNLSL